MAIIVSDVPTMKYYCSLYKHIDNYIYNERVLLHSESLATYHLLKANVQLHKFPYDYELHANRRT